MVKSEKSMSKYSQIINWIFTSKYTMGDVEVEFIRDDIRAACSALSLTLPKNIGDNIYNSRYRAGLTPEIDATSPDDLFWIILPNGISRYKFALSPIRDIVPRTGLSLTKIPDATPGMVAKYAFSDEQALLAKLRYNRMIDIFTGTVCYSLQNHLRTTVKEMGQVETDELYIGVDRSGSHYVFPIQAKGGRDRLNVVQIIQDFALCAEKYPDLICKPIAVITPKNWTGV